MHLSLFRDDLDHSASRSMDRWVLHLVRIRCYRCDPTVCFSFYREKYSQFLSTDRKDPQRQCLRLISSLGFVWWSVRHWIWSTCWRRGCDHVDNTYLTRYSNISKSRLCLQARLIIRRWNFSNGTSDLGSDGFGKGLDSHSNSLNDEMESVSHFLRSNLLHHVESNVCPSFFSSAILSRIMSSFEILLHH